MANTSLHHSNTIIHQGIGTNFLNYYGFVEYITSTQISARMVHIRSTHPTTTEAATKSNNDDPHSSSSQWFDDSQ